MRPELYSRDIVKRCQSLIDQLGPLVERGLRDDVKFGGPLLTTFLLALATPMIVLPIERIFKPSRGGHTVADDRELDTKIEAAVKDVFAEGKRFGDAPFVGAQRWSYVDSYRPFNIAKQCPPDLLQQLSSPEAAKRAREVEAKRILLDLRNALAHGGVIYLDKNGRLTLRSTGMLAFAATRVKERKPVSINVIRIPTEDFRAFLKDWASWLAGTKVPSLLNQEPIAA